jgi:hypothetical protein
VKSKKAEDEKAWGLVLKIGIIHCLKLKKEYLLP